MQTREVVAGAVVIEDVQLDGPTEFGLDTVLAGQDIHVPLVLTEHPDAYWLAGHAKHDTFQMYEIIRFDAVSVISVL